MGIHFLKPIRRKKELIAAMQQRAREKYAHQWYLASVPNIYSFFTHNYCWILIVVIHFNLLLVCL